MCLSELLSYEDGDYEAENETDSEYTHPWNDYREDRDWTTLLDPKTFAENRTPPLPNCDDEYKATWDVDASFWMNDEATTTSDLKMRTVIPMRWKHHLIVKMKGFLRSSFQGLDCLMMMPILILKRA